MEVVCCAQDDRVVEHEVLRFAQDDRVFVDDRVFGNDRAFGDGGVFLGWWL
jgi:hypothetical protein